MFTRFGITLQRSSGRHYTTSTNAGSASSKKTLLVATAGLCLLGSGYYGYEQNKKKGPQPLDPNVYVPLTLTEKEQISPDSYRLRLLTKQKMDNFPVPSCLYIKDDTIQVMRPYTPVNSDPYKDGYIDLVVKRYAGGSVSRTLSGFEPNDKVHVRGPMMEEYEYKENSVDEVGMIAGGTGISPMYQLICRILENPKDQTRIWLVYGNRTEQDILLKAELDDLQKKHGDRLRVKYVLDHPPENWTGGQGFINQGMIEKMLGDEKIRRMVFVCGPNKMLRLVCGERARDYSQGQVTGILARLGLSSKEIWKFQ